MWISLPTLQTRMVTPLARVTVRLVAPRGSAAARMPSFKAAQTSTVLQTCLAKPQLEWQITPGSVHKNLASLSTGSSLNSRIQLKQQSYGCKAKQRKHTPLLGANGMRAANWMFVHWQRSPENCLRKLQLSYFPACWSRTEGPILKRSPLLQLAGGHVFPAGSCEQAGLQQL